MLPKEWCALVAQGIEHRFPKPVVAGSNPAGGTSSACFSTIIVSKEPERRRVIRPGSEGQNDMPQGPFQLPREMMFDANLGEFATKVGFIGGLESNGELSAYKPYKQIKDVWKQLKRTKKNLLDGGGEKRAP